MTKNILSSLTLALLLALVGNQATLAAGSEDENKATAGAPQIGDAEREALIQKYARAGKNYEVYKHSNFNAGMIPDRAERTEFNREKYEGINHWNSERDKTWLAATDAGIPDAELAAARAAALAPLNITGGDEGALWKKPGYLD